MNELLSRPGKGRTRIFEFMMPSACGRMPRAAGHFMRKGERQWRSIRSGCFDGLLAYIEQSVLQGSISASREGGAAFSENGVRCAVRVYERYSYLGQNRLTLTVTLFGRDDALQLFAAASGGSQAVFLKINTLGEEAFLRRFIDAIERYPQS